MPTPVLHFICGSTGAGKTTYAKRLAEEIGGVSFSIDEWMSALFWKDAPDPIQPTWAMERVDRCSRMIWRMAAEIARRGSPCVLEVGLTTRSARTSLADAARTEGLAYKLHFIDVETDERWRRVEARNTDAGGTRQLDFEVTREMFDFVEAMWEPPSALELEEHDGVWITDAGWSAPEPSTTRA